MTSYKILSDEFSVAPSAIRDEVTLGHMLFNVQVRARERCDCYANNSYLFMYPF